MVSTSQWDCIRNQAVICLSDWERNHAINEFDITCHRVLCKTHVTCSQNIHIGCLMRIIYLYIYIYIYIYIYNPHQTSNVCFVNMSHGSYVVLYGKYIYIYIYICRQHYECFLWLSQVNHTGIWCWWFIQHFKQNLWRVLRIQWTNNQMISWPTWMLVVTTLYIA